MTDAMVYLNEMDYQCIGWHHAEHASVHFQHHAQLQAQLHSVLLALQ